MFLLVDKPQGITSHDVVDRVREIVQGEPPSLKLRRVKVGHAGTLDPNATGLLIIGVGRESTKKLGDIAKKTTKEYEAEIFLGKERDTDDATGKIRNSKFEVQNKSQIPISKLQTVLKKFVGQQEQIPPAYSAIKIKGKKAYELARKGKSISLRPRKIRIYSIDLVDYSYPLLQVNCCVSSGTYIRALARDIGKKLGCGAYLKNLRRVKIGSVSVDNAVKLSKLNKTNWEEFAVSWM
jgi:tRNA pseudouridine55 synthase